MLKTKLEVGSVLGFKLQTGDEIIATVSSLSTRDLEIANCFALMRTPDGLALTPWPLAANEFEPVSLTRDAIISFFQLKAEFLEGYSEQLDERAKQLAQYESQIITPDKKIIT